MTWGGVSVETKLQGLRDEAALYEERYRQLAAIKFYLRDVLMWCSKSWSDRVQGATNFGPLLDDIRRWQEIRNSTEPVCLVTFNYDLLLEYALVNARCGFDDYLELSTYLSSASIFKLVKLHGSVHWSRCTDGYSPTQSVGRKEIMDRAARLKTTDEFIATGESMSTQFQGRWLLPAIAIPVQAKDDFECPKEHVDYLESIIPHVTEILVIGWRGREADLIGRLRRGLKAVRSLMVVGADSQDASVIAEALKAELETALEGAALRVGEAGFSHFIRSGEAEAFFKQ